MARTEWIRTPEFAIRYMYQCVLRHKNNLKRIGNKIHKSSGLVYWIIGKNKITVFKPKKNESDRYFK